MTCVYSLFKCPELIDTVTYNIQKKLPYNTRILLTVKQPSGKGDATTASYNTLKNFTFTRSQTGDTTGKYTNPVYLNFSHPINENTVLGNISTSPDMNITEENILISGNRITIYGLPVTFKSSYKITIGPNIEDAYGRKLNETKTINVVVPNAASSAVFPNSGVNIL